jgi:hypothetical protein
LWKHHSPAARHRRPELACWLDSLLMVSLRPHSPSSHCATTSLTPSQPCGLWEQRAN